MYCILRKFWNAAIKESKKSCIIGIFCILFLSGISIAAEQSPVRIGGIVIRTGYYAQMGSQAADAIEWTIKQWNKKGGIKGHPIEYTWGDDETKPERALMIAKRLVTKDRVLAIIGPTASTPSTAAVSPYLNKEQVPFLFSAGGKTFKFPEEKWMFGHLPNTPIVIDFKFKWLKDRGMTRVAALNDTSAFGQIYAGYIPEGARKIGVDVVAMESFHTEDVDLTAVLARIKARNPQGLIAAPGGTPNVRITKQMKQIGLNIPVIHTAACVSKVFLEDLGQDVIRGETNIYADGNIFSVLSTLSDDDPRKKKILGFKKTWEDDTKVPFDYWHAVGCDAAEAILRAVKAVIPEKIDYDNPDQLRGIRADVRQWLENAELDLLTGHFKRSPTDHIGLKETLLVQIVDGKWVLAK